MDRNRHQAALDGIRGFAALSVVLYHVGHWLNATFASNSGLAVDLFFLLSGYVLTLAYACRLDDDLTVGNFILVRVIRLMPLVILSTLISVVYAVLRIYFKHEGFAISALATAALLGIFNLPYLTAPLSIGGNQIFPLNGPQYSLFLELLINFLWATYSVLRNRIIAVCLASACFTVLSYIGLLGGDTPNTFLAGLPRVGASFLAGVAVYHLESILPAWRGWSIVFWICCALMLATFYAPPLSFEAELVWAMTVSPLLVLSGARTVLHGQIRALALLGGRLSYPVYVLHYPLFAWCNGIFQALTHHQNVLAEGAILVIVVSFVSIIVLRFFDEPIRAYLDRISRQHLHDVKARTVA